MGLFGRLTGKIFGAVKKVFGSHKETTGRGRREEPAAEVHREGQRKRRNKLLEERVRQGKSQKVYADKKGTGGSSVTLEDFLAGEQFSRFASSCIYSIVFDKANGHLYLQFLGKSGGKRSGPGRWCQYRQINIQEAKSIYNAASKGVWSWDFLRIRGTRNGTKKPFTMDIAPPFQRIAAANARAGTVSKNRAP